jgi:hypothetical protein
MAYKSDIEYDFDRHVSEDAWGSKTISFGIGSYPEADIAVVMTIALNCKDRGGTIYDIRFGIEEIAVPEGEILEPMDYSIERSKKYIPEEHRPRVLELLLNALSLLISSVKATKITMMSFHRNIPAKGMAKYHKISALMTESGYDVAEKWRDETNGRDYWLYVQRAIEPDSRSS